ncbi:unnamed protein product, partial [marine sediment metagenome]
GKTNLIGLLPGSNSYGAYSLGIKRDFESIKAKYLYIFTTDENDRSLSKTSNKLDESEFIILQTSYENIISQKADVIIPSLTWAERSGSYTNLEGKKQNINRSITPLILCFSLSNL